jgi:hypothetical protein
MPLDLGVSPTKRQEHFGDLFLLAVAHMAGCAVTRPDTDNDSIDWTLSCRLPHRPKVDVQMKTTTMDQGGDGADIRYPLKRKNYDDLIIEAFSPRILVLVALPREIDAWLSQTPEQLVLRRCAYWVSLAGKPQSDNESSVTVSLPRTNLLTVQTLQEMMQRINEKGAL